MVREENVMCQVTVTVELNGRRYQTNVIAEKGMSNECIKTLAEKQILHQWYNKEIMAKIVENALKNE